MPVWGPFCEKAKLFWLAKRTWAACDCLVERVETEPPLLFGTMATDARD